MKRRSFLQAATAIAPAAVPMIFGAPRAFAQSGTFPSKSVRIVVPVSAGGSADKLARVLAQRLGDTWKQTVVVENLPGASSSIGTSQVVRAPADGYTLLLGGDQLAVSPAIGTALPYNASTDLKGITKAVVNPQLLVVRPGLGVRNFGEYVALLKQRSQPITLALPGGNGSLQHLAVEMLNAKLGVKTNNIPYPGGGPATLDVLGGHIDAMLITLAAATENVRAGKLVALAVTTQERSKALPDVPTLQELGVKDYVVESWQGLLVPSKTPPAVIEQIHRDTVAVLRDPSISRQLEDLGFNIAASTPGEVDATITRDIDTYRRAAQAAQIKAS